MCNIIIKSLQILNYVVIYGGRSSCVWSVVVGLRSISSTELLSFSIRLIISKSDVTINDQCIFNKYPD